MTLDPIVEEIHQVRAKLIQQYNNDLHAFCEAIRQSQGTTGHAVVSRSPRPAQPLLHLATRRSLREK